MSNQEPIRCQYPDCTWKTQEEDDATLIAMLQMHERAIHPTPPASTTAQVEQIKRPIIDAVVNTEEWSYFLQRWATYKAATHIKGPAAVYQLLVCCEEQLRRDLARLFGDLSTAEEDIVLKRIKYLAVRAENVLVAREELHNCRQDRDEPVRAFCARLKGIALTCQYRTTCSCTEPGTVDYSDEMIRDGLIRGVFDPEIKLSLLSEKDGTTSLEDTLRFIESREGGKQSAKRLAAASSSAVPAHVSAGSSLYRQQRVQQPPGSTDGGEESTSGPSGFCGTRDHPLDRASRVSTCSAYGHQCDDSQSDLVESMEEDPTAIPSGSAAVPGMERGKLDMSEAEAEETARRDDDLGLVEKQLSRTLRPVLRRCDEVLPRLDGVQVSAITAGQRHRLGRVDGKNITTRAESHNCYKKLHSYTGFRDPGNDTSGLSMSVEVKEEIVGPTTTASSSAGITKLSFKDCRYNSRRKLRKNSRVKRRLDRDDPTTDQNGRMSSSRDNYSDEKCHRCHDCGKTFSKKRHLTSHCKIHSGAKPHRCNDCGKTFTHRSTMVNHRLIHTVEKRHSCDGCGKTFALLSYLTTHRFTNARENLHNCDDCGKTFARKSCMTRHRLMHTGDRLHRCDDCGRTFALESNLVNHRLIHAMEKLYSCDFCEKTFTRKNCMIRHRFLHTGDKPHMCDNCGKKFALKSNLYKHQLTHTGERLFSCDYCEKMFAKRNGLIEHRKIHTEEKPHRFGD